MTIFSVTVRQALKIVFQLEIQLESQCDHHVISQIHLAMLQAMQLWPNIQGLNQSASLEKLLAATEGSYGHGLDVRKKTAH